MSKNKVACLKFIVSRKNSWTEFSEFGNGLIAEQRNVDVSFLLRWEFRLHEASDSVRQLTIGAN